MVWKKDLQKLKQSMGAEETAPLKAAPPPKPKPTEFKPMEEEDQMFLSAMGRRSQPKAPRDLAAPVPPPRPQAPLPEPPGMEFASAMGDLKGLVPLRAAEPAPAPAPPPPPPPPPAPAPPQNPVPEAVPEPAPEPRPAQEPVANHPVQINLAAGMAIEVDGSLDLKGHSRSDGEERLKERVLDSYALGWRTLHVVLGPSPDLREMLMELLKGSPGSPIARYAQAPIPMGGNQAWILYFKAPAPPADNS